MNALTSILIRFGLLKDDLDYHLLRASMVIIFLAFGYQKWWEYEAQVLIPYISNGPLIFWLYPVFGIRGASWFLGASEWLFGALEQKIGNSWSPWLVCDIRRDRHHHPVHAERLGSGCRVSRNGGERSFPGEGYSSPGCIVLFAEAGRDESDTFRPRRR
jgi:hypothetical protein